MAPSIRCLIVEGSSATARFLNAFLNASQSLQTHSKTRNGGFEEKQGKRRYQQKRAMSIFGFYFVSSFLGQMGWPRKQGLLKGDGFDTAIVDASIDQMIGWAAALGAGRPRLALQVIGEMFRDRDWTADNAPDTKTFVDGVQDTWNRSENLSPSEIIKPVRVAKFGKSISVNDFKDARLRGALEQHLLFALLWGLSNPDRFARWYTSSAQELESSLPFMRKGGLVIDALPSLAQHFTDCEQILRDYEREVGVLPPIPPKLMTDAIALGWKLDT